MIRKNFKLFFILWLITSILILFFHYMFVLIDYYINEININEYWGAPYSYSNIINVITLIVFILNPLLLIIMFYNVKSLTYSWYNTNCIRIGLLLCLMAHPLIAFIWTLPIFGLGFDWIMYLTVAWIYSLGFVIIDYTIVNANNLWNRLLTRQGVIFSIIVGILTLVPLIISLTIYGILRSHYGYSSEPPQLSLIYYAIALTVAILISGLFTYYLLGIDTKAEKVKRLAKWLGIVNMTPPHPQPLSPSNSPPDLLSRN